MITLTRTDRDDLALVAAGNDMPTLTLRLGLGRARKVMAMCRSNRGRAVQLVDTYDGLASRPVLEFPPLGVRPGRVVTEGDT